MPESLLTLAGTLGGFGGLACCWVVYFIGRRLEKVETALIKLTEAQQQSTYMDILRFIALPHVSPEVKKEFQSEMTKLEKTIKKQ